MKVIDLFFGHKRVEHDDGRVEHVLRKEAYDAVDTPASQVSSQQGFATETTATSENEIGIARESEDGSRTEGKQGVEAEEE